MLSRFIWKLIQPHLLQVLAKHDQSMKTWLNTEGFTGLEQTIQESCKKIADDICEIVRKIDQDKIRDTEFMDQSLRNLQNKIDTDIKTTVDKLEDKTSAELQRLSDRISALEQIYGCQDDILNTLTEELKSFKERSQLDRMNIQTLHNIMKNSSDLTHTALNVNWK